MLHCGLVVGWISQVNGGTTRPRTSYSTGTTPLSEELKKEQTFHQQICSSWLAT